MHGSRMVAWPRRRLGHITTGGLSLFAVAMSDQAVSKNKKNKKHKKDKKRCKKLGSACAATGRKCCGKLVCGEAVSVDQYCCRAANAVCRGDADCCDGYGCFVPGGEEKPFCKLA